jgi:hypothetical protein
MFEQNWRRIVEFERIYGYYILLIDIVLYTLYYFIRRGIVKLYLLQNYMFELYMY